jgi:hypothetical protein
MAGSGHRRGSLAADDATGTSAYTMYRDEDATRRPRLRGRLDHAEVPPVRDRRPRGLAPRAGRLGAARRRRRAEARRRGHRRGVGPLATNPVGGWYGLRKGYRGRSACTCRRCSRRSASPSSRTTPQQPHARTCSTRAVARRGAERDRAPPFRRPCETDLRHRADRTGPWSAFEKATPSQGGRD